MLAITLFGAVLSGRELAVVATVIIVVAGLFGRYLLRRK